MPPGLSNLCQASLAVNRDVLEARWRKTQALSPSLHHTSTILLLEGSERWEDVIGGSQDVLLSTPSISSTVLAGPERQLVCTSSTTSTSCCAAMLGVADDDPMLKG